MITEQLYKEFLESKDPLREFAHWYIKKMLREKCLPIETIFRNLTIYDNVYATVLFRKHPFQVELFAGPGGISVPEHTHPDVDSYEVYFGGDISFVKNKKETTKIAEEIENEKSSAWGWFMRINSNDAHSAISSEIGGTFLSIQYWKNKVYPSSVGKNWSGEKHCEANVVKGL